MDLLSRVREFVRQHNLIAPGARVLAAVSGGSDSVALVRILRSLADAGELDLVGIAHFNHQLRESADDDERFVGDLARDLGVPFIADRENVSVRAKRERRSLEDAARTARHEFFERARAASGADIVALGHTRDDQAETVLLRLTRGAGPRGLGGMHPRNGFIVRPLLSCRRHELRGWLADQSQAFVEDESNGDVSIPRNRVIIWDREADDLRASGYSSERGGYQLVSIPPARGFDRSAQFSAPILGKLIWGDLLFAEKQGKLGN